jgi:hypothetical protein
VAEQTGYPGADGFLWFSNPGGSGGQCRPGAPPTAQFWPAYAVMLAENWVDRVTGPGSAAAARTDRSRSTARGRHHRKQGRKHKRLGPRTLAR